MHPESESAQATPWEEKRPWLSGSKESVHPDKEDEFLDEITRSALEELRIA